MPNNLSKPFKPKALKNLETIDPIILSAIKEIRKSKVKLIIFFIESASMNSCTYGKRSGPYNQDNAKETIQAEAENNSFIKPLKKPVMQKTVIKVIVTQSINANPSIIPYNFWIESLKIGNFLLDF